MIEPLVSVIIPFFSGVKWLEEALESVISQNYKNIEILVINDGSHEDLSNTKKQYGQIVNFIDQKNGGPAVARNKGIKLASGKYIAFLDSDDVWLEEKLNKQISTMEAKKMAWSQHSYEMFWEKSDKTKYVDTSIYFGNVYKESLVSFRIQTSCVVVLREMLIVNDIWFPVDMRYGQDIVFFRELAKRYSLGYIDGVFTKFRIKGSNAGFRAKIQLADKAATWESIKSDNGILNILPLNVVYAYKLAWLINPIITKLDKSSLNNDKFIEFCAKIFYLLPYILIKINKK